MSTVNYQSVMQAIDDALASPEFRASIARSILTRLTDIMPEFVDDEVPPTLVVKNGVDNFSPHSLAFFFQSALNRRPASDEDIYSLTAHMEEATKTVPGELIHKMLKDRGRSPEKLWVFLKRVTDAHKLTVEKKDSYYEKLKIKTAELIVERAQ